MRHVKLRLEEISKSFVQSGSVVEVLSNLTFNVMEGEFVSIIGPSGSGKTTLFHLIGGLTLPTSGRVVMDGQDITGVRGRISYMPQQPALFPWRTIEDNAVLALEVSGSPKREARALAREWLAKAGLAGYEQQYPHVLSGGMQQRVAYVRAMLSTQDLMCLDEPFGALDALTRLEMQQWLLEQWEQNQRAVLFVTHSIEEALFLSDRILVLSNKPAKVLEEIIVPFARPRAPSVMDDEEFHRLRQQIYRLLQKV